MFCTIEDCVPIWKVLHNLSLCSDMKHFAESQTVLWYEAFCTIWDCALIWNILHNLRLCSDMKCLAQSLIYSVCLNIINYNCVGKKLKITEMTVDSCSLYCSIAGVINMRVLWNPIENCKSLKAGAKEDQRSLQGLLAQHQPAIWWI